MEKKLEEVINRLETLKREVAELEAVVAELSAAEAARALAATGADAAVQPEPLAEEEPVDLSEPIDISLEETDFPVEPAPVAEPVIEHTVEPAAEPEPAPVAEPAAEPEPVEEEEAIILDEAEDLPEEPVSEPEPVEEAAPAPQEEPAAEPEPEVEKAAEPEPEQVQKAEPEEEGFFGLFGEEIPAEPKKGRRRRESIAEVAENTGNKAVVDAMEIAAAWRTDIPGPEVKSLRSAIALGDQVMFISRLFRKDSALYQDTVDRLNRTSTLKEAISYLSETFPEWDLASDDVYKFMMAVRRKIRK